jgi:hypothetical protein
MRHNIRKCSKYLQEQVNNKYNENDIKMDLSGMCFVDMNGIELADDRDQ